MSAATLRILVLSDFDGRDATVIRDFLYCFNAYSRHAYFYFHDCEHLDTDFDFSGYDVIIIFWACWWFWGRPLSDAVAEKIAGCRAVKVQFRQDEYRNVRPFNRLMERLGIQLLFTCVREEDHAVFYPRSEIRSLEAVYTVLTGYVPEYMETLRMPPLATRPIDIGYRSRPLPFHFGDLAREKRIIAQQFEKIARAYALSADISVREADRIYGKQWLRFLQSCKFALGTESGASVTDFTGEIAQRTNAYRKQFPRASYEEVRQQCFADVDGQVTIQTVSPRIFESVACGNVQVLHEGRYAGLLRPDDHYIAVKKDYSNIPEVVAQMRDMALCLRLQRNAQRDLIASGRYGYRAFVRWFDETLEQHIPTASAGPHPGKLLFYLKNYVARRQEIVPWRHTCLRVPRPTLARTAGWLVSLRHVMPQILLVASLLWDVPALWRVLVPYLLRPRRWTLPTPKDLWMDLVTLGTVRAGHGGAPSPPFGIPFEVDAVWREDERACVLASRPPDTDGANVRRAKLPGALDKAVGDDRRWRLAWDHSAIFAECLVYSVGGETPGLLRLEENGTCWFRALGLLVPRPAVRVAILQGLLREQPSALARWLGLRPLVLLYRLPVNLVLYLASLVRTCRGRDSNRLTEAHPVLEALLVVTALCDMPTLRRVLIGCVIRPWRWKQVVRPWLWADLVCLGILRCVRSDGLLGNVLFRVEPQWGEDPESCRLTSVPAGAEGDHPAESRSPADSLARATIAGRRVRRLVWDHSAVASWTSFTLSPYRSLLRYFGGTGRYSFRGLGRLCEHLELGPAAVVPELLAGGVCALDSWRRLRVPVLLYRALFALGRRMVWALKWLWPRSTTSGDQAAPRKDDSEPAKRKSA